VAALCEAQKYIWVSASGTFWIKIQNSSAVFSNEKENLFDCIRVGKIHSEIEPLCLLPTCHSASYIMQGTALRFLQEHSPGDSDEFNLSRIETEDA
jgi:hypothetical protein